MNSTKLKLVIIGGVAGGATAAAKARRCNETAEIIVYEKGQYISFANCGLPYFIGGDIKEKSNLLLQTPENFWKRYRVQVNVNHEVLSIDRKSKSITVKKPDTSTIVESYDKLILCPGAGAIVPPLEGIKSNNIFIVKTVPDAEKIKNFILQNQAKNAVIVGGGFIGLETAEALLHLNMNVSIVELMNQVLPPFDEDMAILMENHLRDSGIELILNNGVASFETDTNSRATQVVLQNGKKVPCDIVVLSIGVRPEIKLAKECGLTIGTTGGIVVNEYQQTSDPDIFAAGDAVEVRNIVTDKPTRFALAGPANKQGRVAGANCVGESLKYKGALGTSIVSFKGVTCGLTGLSEKVCKQENIAYTVSIVHPFDHVTYYPGAHQLHIKLITQQKTGRILGAQVIGEEGVDKRVDVLATAITGKMTCEDLEDLDLAYAPQFGAANDPVVVAGFVAADSQRGDVQNITYSEYLEAKKSNPGVQLVDVRTPGEYKTDHLEDSISLPLDEIRDRWKELNLKQPVVTMCKVGLRGYIGSRILKQLGFDVKNLTGGLLIVRHHL